MTRKKTVALGLLGTTLDAGPRDARRWDKWRPTVGLCAQPDLQIDRLELLAPSHAEALGKTIEADVRQVSPETTVRRHTLTLDDPWELGAVYGALLDFARAYPFDAEREDYLVHITTGTHIAQISLFLLVESRRLPARLVQTSPAGRAGGDAHGKHAVIDLDLSKYDALASRFRSERVEQLSHLKSGIETRNAKYNQLIARLEQVALASGDPILLEGPTGSGKSRLAKRVYELKKARRLVRGPLVEFNCATLRGDGAMSTLFGHVKGAFTGAAEARPGLLRKAHEGVLFLDEIGELGLDEQAMLLRAIEDKTFYPVGSDREVESAFQLLGGTNRDLRAEVRRGAFREDLLARIDLWTFTLPSLRERVEDLEPNLDAELEQCEAALERRVTFSREARERFLHFARSAEASWPGNFRDFSAAIRRMATLCNGARIGVADVDEELGRLRAAWQGHGAPPVDAHAALVPWLGAKARALDPFDAVQLAEVVRVCRESRSLSEAGRVLFAHSRTQKASTNDADRLRKYLARFELEWSALR